MVPDRSRFQQRPWWGAHQFQHHFWHREQRRAATRLRRWPQHITQPLLANKTSPPPRFLFFLLLTCKFNGNEIGECIKKKKWNTHFVLIRHLHSLIFPKYLVRIWQWHHILLQTQKRIYLNIWEFQGSKQCKLSNLIWEHFKKKKKKPFHGQQELAWTMDRAEVACGKWL